MKFYTQSFTTIAFATWTRLFWSPSKIFTQPMCAQPIGSSLDEHKQEEAVSIFLT
ncbi:hypothetical protein FRC14_001723 [Serendipita sp. 396]|nr:hypothetical protein FRC14_001723 [Serendipita sp. 396]